MTERSRTRSGRTAPPEVVARARELFANGWPKAAVARELGISKSSVYRWLADAPTEGRPPRPRAVPPPGGPAPSVPGADSDQVATFLKAFEAGRPASSAARSAGFAADQVEAIVQLAAGEGDPDHPLVDLVERGQRRFEIAKTEAATKVRCGDPGWQGALNWLQVVAPDEWGDRVEESAEQLAQSLAPEELQRIAGL